MRFRAVARLGGITLSLLSASGFAQVKAEPEPGPTQSQPLPMPVPVRQLPAPMPVIIDPPPPRLAAPPPPPAPSLVRPAYPRNQAWWARYFEYPYDLDFLGEEGITAVRATINPEGRVSNCEVTESSGFEGLDTASCKAFTRYARFDPALDRNGKPTQGIFSNRIRWETASDDVYRYDYLDMAYPADAQALGLEGEVGVRFIVDPDGKISQCLITRSSGHADLDGATCSHIKTLQGSKAVPVGGEAPRPRSVRRTVKWDLSDEDEYYEDDLAYADEVVDVPLAVEPQDGEKRLYYAPAPPNYAPKSEPEPIGDENEWITTADYPITSWRNGEEGLVQYTLDVDATGQPTKCTIGYSEASPSLNAATCSLLMERALFTPGVDREGQPIASTYGYETYWRKREPEYAGTFTLKVSYLVDEEGQMQSCQTVERSGSIPKDFQRTLERQPCPGNSDRGVPYRDENGVPVARQVTVTVASTIEDVEDDD